MVGRYRYRISVPIPAITEAVTARQISALPALRRQIEGLGRSEAPGETGISACAIEQALGATIMSGLA